MMRKIAIAGTLILLCAAGAYFFGAFDRFWSGAKPVGTQRAAVAPPGGAAGAPRQQRAAPVEIAKARAEKSTTDIRAVGTLQADESVQITPEIAGRIVSIAFKEGEPVKQGAVLLKLDDSLTRAELAEAEARLEFAKGNYERANALARTGNVTERGREEATSNYEAAAAAVELARVRLAKHALTAPFPGVAGLRRASVGAFINAGTAVVNLEKIDTLKVDFKIPEIYLGDVGSGQQVEVTVDALPGKTFTGAIYAIDPQVDVNGRALQIRARLPNADSALRPGLFARVVIKGKAQQNVVMVPESAVVPRGTDTFVYRVENGKAVETKVRLGGRRAGHVEIVEGVAPEAAVVTAGQQRLRDGATVEVVDPQAQASAPAPG